MIGTDLGEEFDDNFVFPAGMMLVLEPVVWEDGTGGYRSEEIVVITEDGCRPDYRLPLYALWRTESFARRPGPSVRPSATGAGADGSPRPRRPGTGPPGQCPLRDRGAAAVDRRDPAVRSGLRDGARHRRDLPDEHG